MMEPAVSSGVERIGFMKKVLFAALALGFAATTAYAQTGPTPPAPPKPPAAEGPAAAPPLPPGGPDAMRGPDDMQGPGDMRGPERHGHWRKHHGMMMGSKAAHFRIRTGDIRINVKCADDDTTAACGQAVMQLLDKLQAEHAGDQDQGDDDSMMNE
jgi:hypothetical protein